MKDSGPFDIDTVRYVLSPSGDGIARPVTGDFYEALDRDFASFAGHSLVQRFRFSEAWPTWEMHPRGDELVMLLDGSADMVLWQHDRETVLHVDQPGQYVIVPRATWHTARPQGEAEMLFITPGEGTLNAEQPGG